MARDLWRMIGGDGVLTLGLANLVLVLSLGLTLALAWRDVHRVARRSAAAVAADAAGRARLVMVLGHRLVGGGVSPAFARRLARAARISAESRIRPILVVGGATTAAAAGTAPLSEAEAGRRFLAQAGIPDEAILKEEHSRHTLENLRHARTAVGLVGTAPFVLVTSRCHLARSLAMARGLGLEPIPCAAEDRLALDPATVLSLLKEAYFLHWYRVGRTWAGWTNSRRSLARIR